MTAPVRTPSERLGRGIALVFALAIIVVIAFFVLD